ncbi:hypothetical protein CANCADRAFT_26579 [Tortispora caseinolytica NRRL Y-17796]|uniref:Brix domain-containing protein n=1 Tax=Tortispora caseinolytica NRRL Y-17796 TaxID=767744 RepID=A0A1E4TDT8_9ASCO|nr:hypothetical protein CANCADRAFT_26579 [Tortispora caseinolytica NRRL Y-17796]
MSSLYKAISGGSKSSEDKPKKLNRQHVLIVGSRGITSRHRHLINDLSALMPHGHKESKIESSSGKYELNEIADLYNCNNVMYFEGRKHTDLYLHISKTPSGPTVKFHVQNLHTMDELNFTGNCLKGSRPVLSFDSSFDSKPHYQLLKQMFIQIFGVPRYSKKSKPFVDHVLTFSIASDRIWIRNYQIVETQGESNTSLVEIGPRMVLSPITMLEGSFRGPVIYENKEYVSPNIARAYAKKQKAAKHHSRTDAKIRKKLKKY